MDYISIEENELLEWLKDNLDEERYEHSIGVAECAVRLAKRLMLRVCCMTVRNVFQQVKCSK